MSIGTRLDEIRERIERLKASSNPIERIHYLLFGESLPEDVDAESSIIYRLPEGFIPPVE